MTYSLPRCTPESQGVASAAILKFIDAAENQPNELHSFLVLRRGAVIAEGGWNPYRPDLPHMLFSLSKSFTSTAVGLAVSEGRLTVDDRVLSFFPDDVPESISSNLEAMRVPHLLSMSTGHAEDTIQIMQHGDANWIKTFLSLPVEHEPGTHFLYNTGASYMLSAIVQKVTGMTLMEYLEPRLLAPLGIKNATWEMSPQGIATGGYGLSITTRDIAPFGQMYLQKGMWDGKQILPAAWVKEATSKQIANSGNINVEWNQGYGYQFWGCRFGAYRGDGAFGQFCIVMPEQDMVVAINSGVGSMQAVLNLVWDHLLPAAGDVMPDNAKDYEALTHKLGSLKYMPPQGKDSSPIAASVSGKIYTIDSNDPDNDLKIDNISFDFSESGCTLTISNLFGKHDIKCGASVWQEGSTMLFGGYPHMVASGTWTDDHTFLVTIRFYETPFVRTLSCHFVEDRLEIADNINVTHTGTKTYSVRGRVAL